MPIQVPAGQALMWALRALLGYLTYSEIDEILEEVQGARDKIRQAIKEAEEKLPELAKAIQDEIKQKIGETELMVLHRLEGLEVKAQNRVTVPRKGDRNDAIIVAAIKQEIPFRKIIGTVCAMADKTPEINLRRKPGIDVEPKDLLKIKKEVAAFILGVALEELEEGADIDGLKEISNIVDLDLYTLTKSKQLVASMLFEALDYAIEWAGPLKAEVCFGPEKYFDDPMIDPKGPPTRLLRSSKTGFNVSPFYPLPHRKRGAFSADLAIPDYRRQPLKKGNLFAVIEIKFPGDKIRNLDQFERYDKLSEACAIFKTDETTLARTNGHTMVGKGCRVALFRYPEDVKVTARDEAKGQGDDTAQSKNKPSPSKPSPSHGNKGGKS